MLPPLSSTILEQLVAVNSYYCLIQIAKIVRACHFCKLNGNTQTCLQALWFVKSRTWSTKAAAYLAACSIKLFSIHCTQWSNFGQKVQIYYTSVNIWKNWLKFILLHIWVFFCWYILIIFWALCDLCFLGASQQCRKPRTAKRSSQTAGR